MSFFFFFLNKRAKIVYRVLWWLHCSLMDWFAANGTPNEIFTGALKVTCQSHPLSTSIILPSQTFTSCLFPALFAHIFMSFPHLVNKNTSFYCTLLKEPTERTRSCIRMSCLHRGQKRTRGVQTVDVSSITLSGS